MRKYAENFLSLRRQTDHLFPLAAGTLHSYGYTDKLVRFTLENQLTDQTLWKLFAEQFRLKSDVYGGWRGEFFGKMMRGGCLTYRYTASAPLYNALLAAIKDLLSAQEEDGRLSSYPREKEFTGWDLWGRKYAMLGMLYFYDICKNKQFKRKLVRSLMKQADYIVKRVGNGKGKVPITETSTFWGGMNSCSILEPFVKLYELTGVKKYLNFAKYIVKTGFTKEEDLVKACLGNKRAPYQFAQNKAYEMMSCFEGLLEYYRATGEEKYLLAVKNFALAVEKTDVTIIGCSGCTHELFDNSAEKQTEFSEGLMQETCVTVTWMKLNFQLLLLTGDAHWAENIERSALNAMAGSVNDLMQDMHTANAFVWENGASGTVAHESYPFDSYSPLVNGRRGKAVGGFMPLQNGRSYGCCACIGSAGTAVAALFGVLSGENALAVNLYERARVQAEIGGKPVHMEISANLCLSGNVKIRISASGKFTLVLRVPAWSEKFSVSVDGKTERPPVENGYALLEREWTENVVCIKLDAGVKAHRLSGKIALAKGPYVLARDARFFGDIAEEVAVKTDAKGRVFAENVQNMSFPAELTVRVHTENGSFLMCDYAHAGKNYDEETSGLSVWLTEKEPVRRSN